MRIIRRLRSALVIPALALLPLAGCFDTAKPSELSCTQSKCCPDGYVCVGAQTGSPGKCQKPADAGRSDTMIVTDSADNIGSRADADTRADGPVPPNDGPTTNTDTPAAIDPSPSPDSSNDQDTDSDLPASADLGRDVPSDAPISPPETPADTALPLPDLGPDQKPEGTDVQPDVPSGPEVGPDVSPTGCVIGGTSYANSAANPTNFCQICKATTSSSGWSNADEGTPCNGSQYCNSGACRAGCFISGAYYANGAANPANACQTCQPTYATTSWTARASGESCATGQVCGGGTCQSGCWIEGALIGSGTTNSSNVCQVCKPATSTSAWSNNTDGTSCGSGKICSAGICQCATGTDCGTSGCINVNGSDSSHCGSCTRVCSAGQSCSSGNCACTTGAPACGGCLAWDFEWGSTPSPWSLATSPDITSPNGATNIGITQSKTHGGSSSLIAPIQIDSVNTYSAEVTVSLPCEVNLSGYTGWAYVYLAGSYPLTDFSNQLLVDTWSSSGTIEDHVVPFFGNIPTNEWFKVDLGFLSPNQVDRIGIVLAPSSNWTGTMYVDDVVINGL